MEPNILSNKLDAITKSELGIHFNEELVWTKIGGKIGGQRRDVEKRFILAACLTLLILLLPIKSIRNEGEMFTQVVEKTVLVESAQSTASFQKEPNSEQIDVSREALTIVEVKSKGVDLGIVDLLLTGNPRLLPIEMPVRLQSKAVHFLTEDISKIQATLEKSERKNQLKISVKAEVYTSSKNAGTDAEKLKIRLNGRN